jgi:hypothetical protein
MESDKRFPPEFSHERCRYLLTMYKLAKLQKTINAYPLQDDREPTIEELDAFVRKCEEEPSDE